MRVPKPVAVRAAARFVALLWLACVLPLAAASAPYAAMVMDARTGKVLHSENANTRLHPASLTKMMTLYIVFEAVQNGEISMDTRVKVSKKAASEPPSKLGLRTGQTIKLRYLVRAAAVKSANDASTAIAEAISGSEAAFAKRMNRTARAMGMTRTNFKNAHGLTQSGHLSTARDMTILGRHMIYDYPMYYNLFSRRSADAGVRRVAHTNRRLLASYKGADGIKTGYTRAAGFNLVASAERGRERVIATVFGGRSTASRNARVAELLDLGFRRAPTRVALSRPALPPYRGNAREPERRAIAMNKSLRPRVRAASPRTARLPEQATAKLQDSVAVALEEAVAAQALAAAQDAVEAPAATPVPRPAARPARVAQASTTPDGGTENEIRSQVQEVVTRVSTSGGRHWGINVGRYRSEYEAEKVLLKTALNEMSTLDGALRKVSRRSNGFDANFMGLSRETADLACRRLQARNVSCFMIGPS